MKKLFAIIVIFLLTFGALAGCTQKTDQANKENKVSTDKKVDEGVFPVTIKDGLGNDIIIKQKPEKIISLIPSNTEIAFALGLDKEIIGVTDFDNYPKEALTKEKIGGQEFNVEKIVALKPDVVLAHASTATFSKDALDQIRDAGITVLIVNNAQSFNEVYESISMIGKATGEKAKADKMIKEMKDQLASIQAKTNGIEEKKKVFVEVQPAPEIYTTGKKTFIDEMLQAINAKNIADDQDGWVKMDQEAVIERNPDVIITTYGFYVKNPIEQVLGRKGWESVNAIKNKQVFDVNSDRVTRSGPRIIEGVEDIAKAVYPEIFK